MAVVLALNRLVEDHELLRVRINRESSWARRLDLGRGIEHGLAVRGRGTNEGALNPRVVLRGRLVQHVAQGNLGLIRAFALMLQLGKVTRRGWRNVLPAPVSQVILRRGIRLNGVCIGYFEVVVRDRFLMDARHDFATLPHKGRCV